LRKNRASVGVKFSAKATKTKQPEEKKKKTTKQKPDENIRREATFHLPNSEQGKSDDSEKLCSEAFNTSNQGDDLSKEKAIMTEI